LHNLHFNFEWLDKALRRNGRFHAGIVQFSTRDNLHFDVDLGKCNACEAQ